jgi:signal peptidase
MSQARTRGERIASGLRNAVLILVVLMAAGVVAAVASGSYQVRPVLTGSMRPGLPVGGVVVTERVPVSSLGVRDVIVFHRPDNASELVVHRIIALRHVAGGLVIRTQGDNNPVRDPWRVRLQGADAYRAQFSVPLIGYAAIWWHQPQTRTLALGLAGLCALAALLVLALPKRFQKRDRSSEPPSETPDSESDVTDVSPPLEQRSRAETTVSSGRH